VVLFNILLFIYILHLFLYIGALGGRRLKDRENAIYIYMLLLASSKCRSNKLLRGRRGRNRVVVGFITTYAISAYHH
jgi:uncharacterized membrane protein YhaH (DUF805 family)